jgi:tight adherence protein B
MRARLDIVESGSPVSVAIRRFARLVSPSSRAVIIGVVQKLDFGKRRRCAQFAQQLPDGLDQIAQALEAGLSLPQALERASRYMPEPVASSLKRVHGHMSISYSFEESFSQLSEAYDIAELKLVCSGIAVQSRLGGNMKKMLQRSARYCRQSQSLARSLKAQTAQSRLSLRVIIGTPFVLCGVLSILMPGFASNLFGTATGRLMLLVALGLDVVGVFWAHSIMRIDL